ncbi:MAG: SRPBCC family protein [Salinirussus sp.]
MARVVVERSIATPLDRVKSAITDVESFLRSAGFDSVAVDGDSIVIKNHVGLLTIRLDCRLVTDDGALLAYEQIDGIFDAMHTRYTVETASDERVTVVGETTFTLDARFLGPLLDATVVSRQRRRELEAQFDYLEALD